MRHRVPATLRAPRFARAALAALAALTAVTGCDNRRDATAARRAAAPQAAATPASELAAGQRAYAAGDRIGALRHFRAAAEGGNADAQYYSGLMHADGQGAKRDHAEAVKWYTKAVAQNQPDALMALARLRVIGLGVAADPAQAIELYKRAAMAYPPGEQQDQAEAQHQALLDVMKGRQPATR